MPDRPPYDFMYVHTDIPEGLTIREWCAQRAACRPVASGRSVRVRVRRLGESAIGMWRAGARASSGRGSHAFACAAAGTGHRAPRRPRAQEPQHEQTARRERVPVALRARPAGDGQSRRPPLPRVRRPDVDARIAQHLRRQGSPLVAAVIAAGGSVTLERVWIGVDCGLERRLKRRHETPRLCRACARDGRTGGRGPLQRRSM